MEIGHQSCNRRNSGKEPTARWRRPNHAEHTRRTVECHGHPHRRGSDVRSPDLHPPIINLRGEHLLEVLGCEQPSRNCPGQSAWVGHQPGRAVSRGPLSSARQRTAPACRRARSTPPPPLPMTPACPWPGSSTGIADLDRDHRRQSLAEVLAGQSALGMHRYRALVHFLALGRSMVARPPFKGFMLVCHLVLIRIRLFDKSC
jgi:hypothetical protein